MTGIDGHADWERIAEQPKPRQLIGDVDERANRRAFPRYAVDCPVTVIPVAGMGRMEGQLSDLSMGGCLVRLQQRYLAGMLIRVEVQFQLRGIAFRILGVTVGTRGAQSFAIRFLDVPERRREELAEVLKEIVAANAIAAETPVEQGETCQLTAEASEVAGSIEAVEPVVLKDEAIAAEAPIPSVPLAVGRESKEPHTGQGSTQSSTGLTIARNARTLAARERRGHGRHAVDTSVKLLLIKTAISMTGRIANLSMGGCGIRTDERFSVGIFVRVETEFYLHGLPFRIAGVSQAIQDKNTIGIRFLDMSERCRAHLQELIAEIEEAHALERDDSSDQQKANAETKTSE